MLMISFLLSCQAKANWNRKEIAFPADMARVKFESFIPPKSSPFKVSRVTLVWIPKLDEFPGHPARQAIRITLKTKDGRTVDLLETPSSRIDYKANLGQILGQGYLRNRVNKGETVLTKEIGKTNIALVSKINVQEISHLGESLKPFRP